MNIDNLNKLIAHLEAQPEDNFSIRYLFTPINGSQFRVADVNSCGTAACIAGHCHLLMGAKVGELASAHFAAEWLSHNDWDYDELFMPDGWNESPERYSLKRSIATLKRLRDTYLSTGQVVVDWGPEPTGADLSADLSANLSAWAAPQVREVINPALPAELTSLLRNTVEA